MAFDSLAEKLQAVMKKLTNRGRLAPADIKEAMREVRLALLEADVNYLVVKDFVAKVSEKASGSDVLESLTPGQQVIKIVNEELTALMGATNVKLTVASKPPTKIMFVGLQGTGKTTAAAKLALYLRGQGRKPMLVACDIYRPAAIDQLMVLGKQINIPVYQDGIKPVEQIADGALGYAAHYVHDTVIFDTAGRLHIDEELMDELARLQRHIKPQEVLLTVDAMTGQDVVNVAKAFEEKLGIDGVVLTKLDGDTRGGAALSVKAVTGKPIKFASIGEKLNDWESFHPERMASRILGMGDMLSLIEKAQTAFDEKKAQELDQKLRKQEFTLEDFLDQYQQIKSMGSMQEILQMLPGGMKLPAGEIDEKQMARTEAIIRSMTPQERRDPSILNASRKKRIAAGSGTSVQTINQLLKQFESIGKMVKLMGGGRKKRMRFPF